MLIHLMLHPCYIGVACSGGASRTTSSTTPFAMWRRTGAFPFRRLTRPVESLPDRSSASAGRRLPGTVQGDRDLGQGRLAAGLAVRYRSNSAPLGESPIIRAACSTGQGWAEASGWRLACLGRIGLDGHDGRGHRAGRQDDGPTAPGRVSSKCRRRGSLAQLRPRRSSRVQASGASPTIDPRSHRSQHVCDRPSATSKERLVVTPSASAVSMN